MWLAVDSKCSEMATYPTAPHTPPAAATGRAGRKRLPRPAPIPARTPSSPRHSAGSRSAQNRACRARAWQQATPRLPPQEPAGATAQTPPYRYTTTHSSSIVPGQRGAAAPTGGLAPAAAHMLAQINVPWLTRFAMRIQVSCRSCEINFICTRGQLRPAAPAPARAINKPGAEALCYSWNPSPTPAKYLLERVLLFGRKVSAPTFWELFICKWFWQAQNPYEIGREPKLHACGRGFLASAGRRCLCLHRAPLVLVIKNTCTVYI